MFTLLRVVCTFGRRPCLRQRFFTRTANRSVGVRYNYGIYLMIVILLVLRGGLCFTLNNAGLRPWSRWKYKILSRRKARRRKIVTQKRKEVYSHARKYSVRSAARNNNNGGPQSSLDLDGGKCRGGLSNTWMARSSDGPPWWSAFTRKKRTCHCLTNCQRLREVTMVASWLREETVVASWWLRRDFLT